MPLNSQAQDRECGPAVSGPPRKPTLAHDLLREARPHSLDPFFRPRSVAVIGATEAPGSVGRTLLHNLISSPFGGTVYPVNPKRESVLGIRAYPSIADVPAAVDLAVIVTRAARVPAIVGECADCGVPAAVIISAGFHETGPAGAALEQKVLVEARRGRMRIVGPNCLGMMSPLSGLNATFAAGMALPGSVAFLSQSGALLTAILDWSLREQVGFSAFASLGAMIDVGWGDLIDYLGDDPRTRAIVIYMESIGDARAFLSAAREVALSKPIIVIKAGRSEAASRAAASHTGALTGSDAVLDAAFRRSGVLRVSDIGDVFRLADVLGRQPRPRGPRLTIVTNAGGPGVLATDALVAGGGELAPLGADARARLDAVLPAAWSHANPLDILGDADPERYATALSLAADDPASDGLLAILTPQDMTDPTLTAAALAKHAHVDGKPVLASWMGGADVAAGVDILNRAGIPTFPFPDDAARTFCQMWRYADNLRSLYETPERRPDAELRPAEARAIIDAARAEGRTLLDEHESKAILEASGIPTVTTRVARDEAEAVVAARTAGFPVALKLWSRTITHKTDVGGVRLGLLDEAAVREAFRQIEASVSEKVGAEHFLGVTVQPSVDRRDSYELILGQLDRSPARAGVAVRDRRRARRGVCRPDAGASTPQHDAGPTGHRRDTDLACARRCPGAGSGRPGRPGLAPGSVRRSRRRAAPHSGDRRQSAPGVGARTLGARRPHRAPRRDRRRRCSSPPGHPPLPGGARGDGRVSRRNAADHSADSTGGRAALDRVSPDAQRGERPDALHAGDEGGCPHRPRAAASHLLSRLRSGDRSGRGAPTLAGVPAGRRRSRALEP